MATILIDQVSTATKGGHDAIITGIDPLDEDCLIGTVTTAQGIDNVAWNQSGICRDRSDSLNILPTNNEIRDIIDLVN